MEETVKERMINSMFDRWCGQTDYDLELRKTMEEAVKEPNEDTIFRAVAVTEARAYKAGFRDCLDMMRELFH